MPANNTIFDNTHQMHALTPYPITPIGSFMGVVLALLPLTSHIRKLGLGVWGFALWTASANLILFVNTILWHNNVENTAPVWCDISTKLQFGANFGMAASSSAVSLHLYKMTHRRVFLETQRQKRKTIAIELLVILVLPILLIALIVQPIRFQIMEEIGCVQVVYSYVAYITTYLPTILLGLPCLILAPLTMRTFQRHRKEMDEFLQSGQGITHSKYNRLMIMACLDVILVPTIIGVIVFNIVQGKNSPFNYPYVNWKNVHDGRAEFKLFTGLSFSSVLQTPASVWSASPGIPFEVKWNEWFHVFVAVIFFAIFGTTPEMQRKYRAALWFVTKHIGYKRVSGILHSNPNKHQRVLPHNIRRCGSSFLLETTIESSETLSIASEGVDEEINTQVDVLDDEISPESDDTHLQEQSPVL
ncbi:STE3-domain-containing protein [Schizopora paradoxa]|uniref:STE3-domain-containing protein n=1 Tax=Schizopora paradoxa TaxID=27342 RepID=A0A0H2R8N8_9AGAM|nr:STE3-domain-containing protein [Schizopora paradoxa]